MRLIDADALILAARQEGAYGYVSVEEIADAPTIDAGLKFHCRDCIYYERHEEGGSGGTCSNTKFWMPEDGYCSDGETELRDEED